MRRRFGCTSADIFRAAAVSREATTVWITNLRQESALLEDVCSIIHTHFNFPFGDNSSTEKEDEEEVVLLHNVESRLSIPVRSIPLYSLPLHLPTQYKFEYRQSSVGISLL